MTTTGSTRPNSFLDVFDPVCDRVHCSEDHRVVLEEVLELAVELAREGREGRKVGTIFVVGDHQNVLQHSRPMLLDPLSGHAAELRHVSRPEFRENVKELSQLDGAFIVAADGTFESAARYIETQIGETNFIPGLGTRHAAGLSITTTTDAVAIVVSQSSVVRVFANGEIAAEIIPELWMLTRERLFAQKADVRELPERGLAIALAADRRAEARGTADSAIAAPAATPAL